MSSDQSFRGYLERLADQGELVEITEPVSTEGEIAGCLSLLDAGPAVRLSNVVGCDVPVVGNVLNRRARMAAALDVDVADLVGALSSSIASPRPTRQVDSAPWLESVSAVDFGALPVPTFFARETGPYLSAGVILARDVVTGARNMSFARFKILGPDTAMLGVSPNHHLGRMVASAAARGQHLPISVAIGNHPAVMFAACLYLGLGDDEAECAGGLLGAALDVAASPRFGIPSPAGSEIVLEAEVIGEERIPEGPVSEYHGMYHEYGSGYLTQFVTQARRADAMFQVIMPGLHQEHILLGAVAIAASLQQRLQATVPSVVSVAVPDTAAGRTAAVVGIEDPQPGQVAQVIMACFALVPLIKQVVVVDADIDVWNTKAVEWARMTACRPERDVLVIPNARTDRSEPLQQHSVVGKLGVDATRKPDDRATGADLAVVPAAALHSARDLLHRASIAEAPSALLSGIGGFWDR